MPRGLRIGGAGGGMHAMSTQSLAQFVEQQDPLVGVDRLIIPKPVQDGPA